MDRKHNDNSSVATLASKSCLAPEEFGEGGNVSQSQNPRVLFIEPFYGGSHKQLLDFLTKHFSHTLVTMSAKKWPWRARCAALYVSDIAPQITSETVLFCSSVLSLAELLGLRPDLNRLTKIVYFHENQFVYPIREIKDRDVQFAYNQITTCLSADKILFNSDFNKSSLLDNLGKIAKLFPDYRPKRLREKIEPKCSVLYFPVVLPGLPESNRGNSELHIVWPHRWEFDKDPETFLQVLQVLHGEGFNFKVHIVGAGFVDVPDAFKAARDKLGRKVVTCGFVESREEYLKVLSGCHVAVSSARHEFFGVAMLEATYCGCLPLVPNRLVYPELYPVQCLYKDVEQLQHMLRTYCLDPGKAIADRAALQMDFTRYDAEKLLPSYSSYLCGLV